MSRAALRKSVSRPKHSASRKDKICKRLASSPKKKLDTRARQKAARAPERSCLRTRVPPRFLSIVLSVASTGVPSCALHVVPPGIEPAGGNRTQQPPQFRPQRRERRQRHRTLRMYDDVPSRRNLRLVTTQNVANPPLDAVPHHRPAQRFLHADPEAAHPACARGVKRSSAGPGRFSGRFRKTFARSFPPGVVLRWRCMRAEENGKLRARAALSGAINSFVLHALQQAHGAGETLPRLARTFLPVPPVLQAGVQWANPAGRRVRFSRWA